MKKCLVIKNKCLPLYRVKEITQRTGPVPRTKITTVMATLKYTTREINGNYKIKVSGLFDGKKVNTLVGVSGFLKMVNDIELCNRLLDRAFACMDDKCVCKLRRGLKISFYVA